jgi:hypothetical protein
MQPNPPIVSFVAVISLANHTTIDNKAKLKEES